MTWGGFPWNPLAILQSNFGGPGQPILLLITGDYWRLLEIARDYWRLLEIARDYWRLLEITRDSHILG